jgi:hypothetical protein
MRNLYDKLITRLGFDEIISDFFSFNINIQKSIDWGYVKQIMNKPYILDLRSF